MGDSCGTDTTINEGLVERRDAEKTERKKRKENLEIFSSSLISATRRLGVQYLFNRSDGRSSTPQREPVPGELVDLWPNRTCVVAVVVFCGGNV